MINLASQLSQSAMKPVCVCMGKHSLYTIHTVTHVCARLYVCAATLTPPTAWRVTCQEETNVCVSKRLPGVRGGGFSGGTTSEAFIVELKAVPEPQILLIKPSAPNRGTVRGLKPAQEVIEKVNLAKHKLFAYWFYPVAGHRWATSD